MKIMARYGEWILCRESVGYSVQREVVVPEANDKGKPNKGAGEKRIADAFHYGKIEQAVARLAEECADGSLIEWLDQYRAAVASISDQLAKEGKR